MNPDLQKLNDMLAVMQSQRDNLANVQVVLQAENVALKRRVAELEAKIPQPEEARPEPAQS